MAIPTFVQGDTPEAVEIVVPAAADAIAVEYQGIVRTFAGVSAGATCALAYTRDEVAGMKLGTYPLTIVASTAGRVKTYPFDARIKVTDCPGEAYNAQIVIDSPLADVPDLDDSSTLGDVKRALKAVLAHIKGGAVALALACGAALADPPSQLSPTNTLNDFPGTATIAEIVGASGVSLVETDPTVPNWAKQPEPPQGGLDEVAVRGIVGALAETGTVFRASSLGDADTLTDATGCVWRVSYCYSAWTYDRSDAPHLFWTDSPYVEYEGGPSYDCIPGWYFFGMSPAQTGQPVSTDREATVVTYMDPGFETYVATRTRYAATNLVGRIALTNDLPDVSGFVTTSTLNDRLGEVDRPYTMIQDPVAGRALMADGRLVNYGKAPRISGRFVVTPDHSASSGDLGDFMPTIALLNGATNLLEGVHWTSTVTPSVSDGHGGYYKADAEVEWATTNGYSLIPPVRISVEKAVSAFGTSATTELTSMGYQYFTVELPGLGYGECSIYDVSVESNRVAVGWGCYDYDSWNYYSGHDEFTLEFVDEGGDGMQYVAFGDLGRLATTDEVRDAVEDGVSDALDGMDSVRSRPILRTGKSMEYGDGWGRLRYDFTGTRRWWELQVPSLVSTVSASGYPFTLTSVSLSAETSFVGSTGTNGTERCQSSVWNVVYHIGDLDVVLRDVTVTNGLGVTSFTADVPPTNAPVYYSSTSSYADNLHVTSTSGVPGSSPTITMQYTYQNGYTTKYTGTVTLRLSAPIGSYTVVEKDYHNVVGTDTAGMLWDAGLQRTWQLQVSNGCFFAEIVSTNNLVHPEAGH